MTPDSGKEDSLLIRCPGCGQRFKVEAELKGRTVECGTCHDRFVISEDLIMRGRRFYPGEKGGAGLAGFQRMPEAAATGKAQSGAVNYQPGPPPVAYEPPTPQRILAGVAGGLVMVLAGLFLLFAKDFSGPLAGVNTGKRVMIAGFAGVLGLALLVYGNPRARWKALLFGGLLAGGLVAVPLFVKPGTELPSAKEARSGQIPERAAAEQKPRDIHAEAGLAPVDQENARLEAQGISWKVSSLWIRGLREQNKNQVRDYLARAAQLPLPPSMYKRGEGNFLAVLSGAEVPFEKLRDLAETFGKIVAESPDFRLIEVVANNEVFREVPMDKLTDNASPSFYDLNKNELASIDLERVKRAVIRLTAAEPRLYREDISQRLVELLKMPAVDFKPEVARALRVWGEPSQAGGVAVIAEIQRLMDKNLEVSDDFVELMIQERPPGTVDAMVGLWVRESNRWENHLSRLGQDAEKALLARLPDAEGGMLYSLVRLLGNCGGRDAANALSELETGKDSELKLLVGKSIAQIREREK